MKSVVGLYLILVYFELAKSDTGIGDEYYSDDTSTPEYENYEQEYEMQGITETPPIYSLEFHLADFNEFPYHVAIVYTDRDSDRHEILCQGALVSRDWLMTSAYCIFKYRPIFDINKLKAYTGTKDFKSTEGYVFRLLYYVYHPYFNSTTGEGYDVALWKLEDSISKDTENTNDIYLLDPSGDFYTNCQYSSFIGQYLYGESATLEPTDIFCTEHGIPDNTHFCVVINDTMHDMNKDYDWGSPLVCGGKLYAMRNVDGFFSTVYDTAPWILRVIDVASSFERKENQRDKNMDGLEYGGFSDYESLEELNSRIYEAILRSGE